MINSSIEQKLNNYSTLSDQECALIIRSYLLEALESDTYFEWELVTKFLGLGYEIREPLRNFFDSVLRRNEQKIAGIAVKDWLQRYLVKNPLATRAPNTFFEFVANNPDTRILNGKDQVRLMRIFRMYDYLLVSPIFDMEDKAISSLLRFPMRLSQTPKEIWTEMQSAETETAFTAQTASENLAVKEALRKFPNLGEQPVTMSPIKLKQFDHPVRPSVRNWLYDYTMQLGQTGHSSMDRTNYLFRSDNAKNLSSPERDKLAIILKSFDENALLPIDGKRQEIVFESFAKKEASPKSSFPAPPQPAASISFIHHAERPAAPVQRNISSAPKQQFPPVQRQENSFVRPYPQPVLKSSPPVPSKREISPSMSIPKPPPDEIEYTNPYPEPGTHEMLFEKSNDNIANIRFSEGAPKDSFTPISQVSAKKMPAEGSSSPLIIPARPLAPAAKSAPLSSPPAKPAYRFTPPDRNIIQPHYGGEARSDKPEPKIQGNTVDLRE